MKILLSCLGVFFFAILVFFFLGIRMPNQVSTPIPIGVPVRLEIPSINIHVAIEHVGLTANGVLGVPTDPARAAWFDQGPRPGEKGNAIIDGHFGWRNDIPAAFDSLNKLVRGDKIFIVDEQGATTTFVVRNIQAFGKDRNIPGIFNLNDGKAHLNLITCQGTWNETDKSYAGRLVVLADRIDVPEFPSVGTLDNQITYSSIRSPALEPQGLPVRLKIPAIKVDSAVEDALITPEGRMDVTEGSKNVAWFALGPHPGQVGSAVIGGHYGMSNGVPRVFNDLNKLKIGDNVYVVDDKNNLLTFIVRRIGSYDRNADATKVFTSSDGLAHLNLITCEGTWNEINGTYPKRLVLFTDLVPVLGATYYRSLSLGMSGLDVIALQTALEKKRFLVMPYRIAKGYFGALTSTAVARYQTSIGLPAVGIFGPRTRDRIIL